MRLYDGTSPIDWVEYGEMSREEMDGDYRFPQTGSVVVLLDREDGKVEDWRYLGVMCGKYGVKVNGDPEGAYEKLEYAIEHPAPTIEQRVSDAEAAAAEAKELASQAGTDPQIKALASLQVMAMDLSAYNATQVASFRDYWPEWQEGVSYKQNDCVRYDGKYWRVSQDTTSQGIYPPGTSESLYYEVELAPDGIIVYRECHGSYDQVEAGEMRHYPDADGPVYRAKVDTAYDPDTVPDNWELVEE